jgi:two-component system OmpR family response regulator
MASALAKWEQSPAEVVICDIGLPDGDGWQLMKQVCGHGARQPFGIAMSGYSGKADIERSLEAGFRHHLVKPFVPDELDLLLREAASFCN